MPFATLDDPAVLQSQVQPLVGKLVTLEVTPSGVSLREATAEEAAAAKAAGEALGTTGACLRAVDPRIMRAVHSASSSPVGLHVLNYHTS